MYFSYFVFLEYQENINGSPPSMTPARTSLAQQTSIEPINLSNMQGENKSEPLEEDNIVNQQQPINSRDFSQIMNMDSFSDSNVQKLKGRTFTSNQVQNKERSGNLTSHDLSQIMNMNPFSDDDLQHDQQRASNEPSSEESQEQDRSTEITPSIDEIMNTNIFDSINSIRNGKESQLNVSFDSQSGSTSTQDAFPKQSGDNSSMMKENFDKNKSDSKENIRKVLNNHKYYSSTQIEYGKDLAEYIPGLYRLLDLCKDDGSNGLGKFFYIYL
jgi:hypothetical protein